MTHDHGVHSNGNGNGNGHHAEDPHPQKQSLAGLFSQFDALRGEWVAFVDQLEGLLRNTGETMNNEGKRTVHGMESQLREVLDGALKSTKKKGLVVKKYAEDNPWRLASASLAAGLIAGYFLSRKHEPQD